jgi:hypothetical protein
MKDTGKLTVVTDETVDLFDHITKRASALKVAEYRNHTLVTREGEKIGNDWKNVYKQVDTLFVIDLPNLQIGWLEFVTGTGRVLTVAPVGQPKVAKPSPKATGVAVVPIASETMHLELEIADTAMRDAFKPLLAAYRAAREMHAGQIPVVRFDNKLCAFSIEGWDDRDEMLGDRLDGR